MTTTTVPLLDIRSLHQEIMAAAGVEALEHAVLVFLRQHLQVESAVFCTVPPKDTAVAHVPIGNSYWLTVQRSFPLTTEETGVLELIASFCEAASLWQQPPVLRDTQTQLLSGLQRMVFEQQRMAVVKALLAKEFAQALPGAQAILYLLDGSGQQLAVQTVLGAIERVPNLAPAPVAGVYADVIARRETVIQHEAKQLSLWLPIKIGERVEGILQVGYAGRDEIAADEQHTLNQIAAYIGVTLNSERLLEQSWHRSSQMEAIFNITAVASEERPLAEKLQAIVGKMHTVFGAPLLFIALYDLDTQIISFPTFVRDHQFVQQSSLSMLDDKSLAAWVIANNQPFTTDDLRQRSAPAPGFGPGREKVRSIVMLPLAVNGRVLGVLSIQSNEPNAFDASDLQTITIVANHVALLIHDSQLKDSNQPQDENDFRYQTAVALRQAMAIVSTSLDQPVILQQLISSLHSAMQFERAHAFLLDEGRLRLIIDGYKSADSADLPPFNLEAVWQDHAYTNQILATKEPLVLSKTQTEAEWPALLRETAVRSWLGVPLTAGGVVHGLLHIESTVPSTFTEQDVQLAISLGAHAAVALQNAATYQKTQRQLSELNTLYQASATMTANLDQDFVLQTVAKEMLRVLKGDNCSIFVWNETHQRLIPTTQRYRSETAVDADSKPSAQYSGLRRLTNLFSYAFIRKTLKKQEVVGLVLDETATNEQRALLEAAGLQTLLLVPLVRRKRLLGLLALGYELRSRTFDKSALQLAQDLGGQAAVAIEHANLFAQAQRRIEELATFHEIVLQLNTPLKLSAVLDAITDAALKLISATNLHIFLYDAERDQFTFGSALWEDGRREPAVSSLRPEGLTATVVRRGKPVVVNDAANHPLFNTGKARSWGIHAIAGFPLHYGDHIIGAFTVTYLRPHVFSKDELLLLNLLADQASVAVRNARLYAESQRRVMDMAALVELAKQVTGKLKLELVLQTTVNNLRSLLKARASTITMLSEDKTELVVQAASGADPKYVHKARMRLGEGISGRVVKHCEMVYIRDSHKEQDFLFFDDVVRSLLAVPLIVRDEAIGTLTIDSDQPNAFSDSDIQLMTIAAAQASVAIVNARLFEEAEQRAQELSVAYEELKENDRLKDELVQNVSHELRTPLTFVKGYVDLLMDGEMGLLSPEQQEALEIVSGKTDEITRIIDDIITLQRIDAGNLKLEAVVMSKFLATAVANHNLVANKKGLSVVLEDSQNTGEALIDRQRIQQVMDNLIGNAMKFSPDGGIIKVSLSETNEKFCIVVADQGIGVPQDKQERIFDRFYQVDGSSRRRFGGTGIGLAIVKRIISAHEGRIWVESEPEQGSSFYFTLPIYRKRKTAV